MAGMFSKKHYEAIATVIKTRLGIAALSNKDDQAVRARELDAVAVAFDKLFKTDNPKYQSDKFFKACGISA